MKKYVVLSLIIIAVIAITSAIVFAPKTENVIKIGAIYPLTGNLSFFGESGNNGSTLAVEEYNSKNNNWKVKLIMEDSQADPQMALTAVTKLTDVDNVDYMYATLIQVCGTIAPIVEQKQIPTFIEVATSHLAADNNYIYKFFQDMSDYGKLISYDLSKKKLTTVSLIIYNTEPGDYFIAEFEKSYDGNILSIERFNNDERDYKTYILKAEAKHPDAIVFIAQPTSTPYYLNDMVKLNYKIPLYMMLSDFDNINNGAKQALKFLEPISTWYTFDSNKSTAFITKYKARFGKEPDAEAAYNYSGMKIMLEAINQCGRDRYCFHKTIIEQKFNTIIGKDITFSSNKNAILPVDLIQYDSNKERWVSIK